MKLIDSPVRNIIVPPRPHPTVPPPPPTVARDVEQLMDPAFDVRFITTTPVTTYENLTPARDTYDVWPLTVRQRHLETEQVRRFHVMTVVGPQGDRTVARGAVLIPGSFDDAVAAARTITHRISESVIAIVNDAARGRMLVRLLDVTGSSSPTRTRTVNDQTTTWSREQATQEFAGQKNFSKFVHGDWVHRRFGASTSAADIPATPLVEAIVTATSTFDARQA